MKKVTYVGIGLLAAALIGWATLAYAQQQGAGAATLPQNAQQAQGAIEQGTIPSPQRGGIGAQQNAFNQRSATGEFNRQPAIGQEGAARQPGTYEERSVLSGAQQQQPGEPQLMGDGQRGELGVWLVATGGPGVEIRRITGGSAAELAGLQRGDVILQVNGRWAASPQEVAEMIRQIPIGEAATLNIWRDGQQQQLMATLQPAREDYQVAFRGESAASNGDMASRTMRLEEQLSMVMQELKQLRQEVSQLKAGGSGQPANLGTGINQGATRPGFDQIDQNRAQADPFGNDSAEQTQTTEARPADEAASAPDPFGPSATEPTIETETEVDVVESETPTETPAATETEGESDSLFE